MSIKKIIFPDEIQEINDTIFASSSNTFVEIFKNWPNILAALIIIAIGWIIMKILNWIIIKTAKKFSFHKISKKSGFTKFLEKAKIKAAPSEVIANFLGGYIFTMFFLAASKVVGLTAISDFLQKVIQYIPNVVVALFIVLIGISIANTTKAVVESTVNILDSGGSKILGIVAKNIIILFSILAALWQLNIAEELVKILFIGIVATVSIAGGLSIGLGAKDLIKDILIEMRKK